MKKVILLSLVSLLLLAGCATLDQATGNYCDSLGNFATAVVTARQIDENSTIDEAKDAQRAVTRAWDDLVKSAGNLRDAKFNELEGAYNEFEKSVNDIPNDATLAEAQAAIDQAALDLLASYVDIASTTCEYPQVQPIQIQTQ